MILFKDPPSHAQYRRVVVDAFLPRAVRQLDDLIGAVVAEVLETVRPRGRADLVAEVAVPVPLRVIASLLGVPRGDHHRLLDWTDQLERHVSADTDGTATLVEMSTYLAGHVSAERARGGDGLVAAMAAATVEGRQLTDGEITINFASLLFGGNDTIRNAFSLGVLALLDHPEQLELLRTQPELVANAAEEVLRWSTPLNYFARTATLDTALHGIDIAAGDRLVMWYASGARDAALIADPDVFDITRSRAPHPAFGAGGPHFCMGAELSRTELKVMLAETCTRLAGLRRCAPATRVRSTWVNGLATLPVEFAGRAGPAI
ncbi:MAG: cytochrome P450 [Sporichthyaceae bacterium]